MFSVFQVRVKTTPFLLRFAPAFRQPTNQVKYPLKTLPILILGSATGALPWNLVNNKFLKELRDGFSNKNCS